MRWLPPVHITISFLGHICVLRPVIADIDQGRFRRRHQRLPTHSASIGTQKLGT
ncbi:hypothetical protein ACQ7HM_01455 [Williamsia sp. MIQD14]|uniref:hypothetical protein n=1 Tax=Williamsia sp. MIQD14 TaxID=3425703 RepID=UPI003D9FD926